jgi:hypothetical protein
MVRKFLSTIACLLLLAAPAHAQKTPTALVSEVDLNLADNTSGLITPAIVRTTLIDIINSMLTVLASPSINSTFNSVYGTPTVSSGACGAGSNGTIASGSVNQSGQLQIGASATISCVVTFVPVLTATPSACDLTPQNAAAATVATTVARVATVTTAGFGVAGSALANANYWWHCF